MTKYILHGGNTSHENQPDNEAFFHEITKGLGDQLTILLVYFARKEDDLTPLIKQDREIFIRNAPDKQLTFELATIENFREQAKGSQVIYLRGGNTAKLKDKLAATQTDFKTLFEGKTIVGSSAGCYVLGSYYWDNEVKNWDKGLGLVPLKTICHYEDTDEQILRGFKQTEDNLPLLVLPDYKWQVFYV